MIFGPRPAAIKQPRPHPAGLGTARPGRPETEHWRAAMVSLSSAASFSPKGFIVTRKTS
ncbi:MAG: hypothetical protein QOG83_3274, partial [Alphaproteobacteria bacterium]|nr:hypothetical protein [Alphaproteobacteria bacterium]